MKSSAAHFKLIALIVAVTGLLVPSAGAGPTNVEHLQSLSAASAFDANCSTLIWHGVVPDDFEMETTIAVNRGTVATSLSPGLREGSSA